MTVLELGVVALNWEPTEAKAEADDCAFYARLGYIVRSCFRIKTKTKQKTEMEMEKGWCMCVFVCVFAANLVQRCILH